MNNRLFVSIIASNLALVFSPCAAFADSDTTKIEKIVVSATRTPQALEDTLAPTILIDREDIERSQAIDIADLLRFHAGIDIARNGGPGSVTSIFTRGTESDQTLILVDGIRINEGSLGSGAIQNIDPDLIERIEIVKGPRSVLYGSDAIGGVINIITRRATEAGNNFSANIGYGGLNTKSGSFNLSHYSNNFRAGINVGFSNTDGFSPRTIIDNDRGNENRSVNAYIGFNTGKLDLEFGVWNSETTTGFLDGASFARISPLTALSQDQTNNIFSVKANYQVNENVSSTITLSTGTDDIEQNESTDFTEIDQLGLDWQNDIVVDENQLITVGLALTRQDFQSRFRASLTEQQIDNNAIYVQDNIQLENHDIVLGLRHTDNNGFGEETTWSIDYGFHLTESTQLIANVGTAFRTPGAFDLSSNPSLDPETSRNIEIGIRYSPSRNQSFRASAFKNEIDNLITFDPNRPTTASPFGSSNNIQQATIEGLELGYNFNVNSFNTSIEAIIQNPVNDTTGDVLLRRAKRSVTAQIDYTENKLYLGASILLSSQRNDIGNTENAGYFLLNLLSAYDISPKWTVRARLENALDKQYELANGFNTTDRTFFFELGYTPFKK